MSERELTMSEALNEALHEEMRRDEKVLVIGEDIAGMGGLFQVTAGLLEQFGARRVIDSPISEAGIAGAGVGAAIPIPFEIGPRITNGTDTRPPDM